eukprot:TRINITY_DN49116_c0_g1_i2.p1 TRINITY_DN49116_c0_g1~~TRINITY_DN49116_c0_g1_i2.p1  ORF type:complete len:272 (+),score=53.58 TRINITY_DN49116_c0_g1_i2:200-1015(+)
MVVGAACSEVFSGPQLAAALRPGMEYEMETMRQLSEGNPAPPLSIHTSAGVPGALNDFVAALEPHLAWEEREDWCVSLQMEGSTAVMAGCDLLIQIQQMQHGEAKSKVAVGMDSYHGPGVTAFGSRRPLNSVLKPPSQLQYPVPSPFGQKRGEHEQQYHERLVLEFGSFLERHSTELAVMLVEPQWGSSLAGLPWPRDLLRKYIQMAQANGVLVLCDEIMCGLGRHGHHTLFLSLIHISEPTRLLSISYAVFCLKKKKKTKKTNDIRERNQ